VAVADSLAVLAVAAEVHSKCSLVTVLSNKKNGLKCGYTRFDSFSFCLNDLFSTI
jgi:hypothetical protein